MSLPKIGSIIATKQILMRIFRLKKKKKEIVKLHFRSQKEWEPVLGRTGELDTVNAHDWLIDVILYIFNRVPCRVVQSVSIRE